MQISRAGLAIGLAVFTGCAGPASTFSSSAPSAQDRSSTAYVASTSKGAEPLKAAAVNLIANGSFETPDVPNEQLTRFGVGQLIGPWTVVGPSGGTVDLLGEDYPYGGYIFEAKAGKQQLDLTGATQDATGVAQTVKTVQGQGYTLSFYVGNVIDPGNGLGTSSTVHVSLNGRKIFTAVNSGQNDMMTPFWKKFTVTFTAPSAKSKLTFVNGDPSDDTYDGLDDIVLTAS